MGPRKWWKKVKEDRERLIALEIELTYETEEKELAMEHLANLLFEFYGVWERHEGKNKPSLKVHNANEFIFQRDGGKLGAELRQRKLDKREEVWKKGNGVCYICNKKLNQNKWTIDHVIPVSKGGSESLHNLMPTHKICNERKADKIINSQGDIYYGTPMD